MAEKMREPISHVRGWVNIRIAIVVARLYYCIICVYHLPITFWYKDPYCELGLGSGLAQ